VRTSRLSLSDAAIREAAEALVRGRLVAFPTETVYGLGARADRAEAVLRIFAAKGRPSGNPLIVHVADREAARALASEWPDAAEALGRAFWPGPLTLVVRREPRSIVDEACAGGATVGVRVPAHPVALELLRIAGVPVAAPSANRSTTISPTTAEHVLKTLEGRVDVVLDAGPTGFGIESTIVDVTRVPMRLLRHGAIPLADIARFGEVVDATAGASSPEVRAEAPGMHAKHYAPRAKVILVEAAEVAAEVAARQAAGQRTGAIERAPGTVVEGLREGLAAEPEGYARELYAALHRLDDAGCDAIVIAQVPDDGGWAAVRDRLRRASADESL